MEVSQQVPQPEYHPESVAQDVDELTAQ